MQKPRLPAQPNESLINGIAVLQRVVSVGAPAGSREIARQMGMSATRVNRLLGTLAFMGLLERDADRKYRPGPALHALAAQSMMASGLLPAALPALLRLRGEGYTVGLATLWAGRVCYLFHERPGQSLEDAILRHELWPVQYSGAGVALLAAQHGTPDEVESAPMRGRVSLLPDQGLSKTVAFAREHGYALLRFDEGAVSIGVAVGSPPIAGLAVSRHHLGEEFIPEIAARLRQIAEEIVKRMEAPLPLNI